MTPDHINGLFELFGAILLLLDVIRLRRDRRVLGVHWGARAFFTTWGLWNLYYYPAIGQMWSLVGAAALVMVNAIWLVQLGMYAVDRKVVESLLIAEPLLPAETRRQPPAAPELYDFVRVVASRSCYYGDDCDPRLEHSACTPCAARALLEAMNLEEALYPNV